MPGDIIEIYGGSLGGVDPNHIFSCVVKTVSPPDDFVINAGEYKAVYYTYSPDQYFFSIDTLETDTLDNQLLQVAEALAGAINLVKNSGCTAYSYKNRVFVIVGTTGDASVTHALQYIPANEQLAMQVSDAIPYVSSVSDAIGSATNINLNLGEESSQNALLGIISIATPRYSLGGKKLLIILDFTK